jgi:hypothetical protein
MKEKTLIFIIITILYSCSADTIDMSKVTMEVNQRITLKKLNKIEECKAMAQDSAEIFVDSIMTDISKNLTKNDLYFPNRPKRDTNSKRYEVRLDTFDINKLRDSMVIKHNK